MSDAAAIDRSLEQLTAGTRGRGETRAIRVGSGVIAELPAWLAAQRLEGPLTVVCDPNTARAAGHAVVAQLASATRDASLHVIEPQPGHDELVCDDAVIDELIRSLASAPEAVPIAVGAGTVNDIVKMASARLGRDYLCVPTAASMNGYTSAIAAVLSRGVKRTLTAQQPMAIFADIEVVRRAPARLNLAGFGDLLSKPYSHADWLLSHRVRAVPYHERPAQLLDEAYDALLSRAREVGAAEVEGTGTLLRTILLSGFTMAIAGTSAPASGGEHLISHYWDMLQHASHRPLLALHGTQVGIATRMSAMLFERLVALEPADLDPGRAGARRSDRSWLEALSGLHPDLPAEVVAEMKEQIAAKQKHGDELVAELSEVKARWPEIREELAATLVPSRRITEVLRAAGAPDRPSAIGVDRALAARTLKVCRHMRNRYVALDLLDDLGFLDGWADEVVAACETD